MKRSVRDDSGSMSSLMRLRVYSRYEEQKKSTEKQRCKENKETVKQEIKEAETQKCREAEKQISRPTGKSGEAKKLGTRS